MAESTPTDEAATDGEELVVTVDTPASAAADGATTLIRRDENPGAPYPQWIERLGLIGAIIGAVLLCQWLWSSSGLDTTLLWALSVCGLPLATLLISELFGRMVTAIHNSRH